MATTLAKYQFDSASTAEVVFSRIKNELINGIERFGDTIHIGSDCENISKASQICQANGGRAV